MEKLVIPTGEAVFSATIPALFLNRVKNSAEARAFAQKRDGVWNYVTWKSYGNLVARLILALEAAGMKRGDRVGIIGDVSQEWLLADMATLCAGGVTVGIYFTSSPEEIQYYLEDSGTKILFVGDSIQLEALLKAPAAAGLNKIVVMNPAWNEARALPNIVTMEEFISSAGEGSIAVLEKAAASARNEDIASIGYTSGTTGNPKGAILTHRSLLGGAQTIATLCPAMVEEEQRIAVHLPFSHTVARAQATTLPIISRVVPYFGDSTANFAQTIRDVKPTYYMAPPRFYQRFAAQLISKVQNSSADVRVPYAMAMSLSKKAVKSLHRGKKPNALLAELVAVCRERVFRPLLEEIGFDELKYPYTASAPMPSEVMTLWQTWGLNLKEAYGQTEMVGGNLAQMHDWPKPGTVGHTIPSPGWKTEVMPDGEMRVQGPGLFVGYWNKLRETAEALKDGWLMTGDIVEVQPDGAYKLVDRKKEIINTSGGKSISPTQVENELRKSPYISEAAVIGEGKKYIVALIEVDAQTTRDWAAVAGVQITSYEDFSKSDVINRLIEGEVAKANSKLARVEQVKAFRILPEELSPDTGVMTATRKKRRKPLADRYRDLIASMYEDSEELLIKQELA